MVTGPKAARICDNAYPMPNHAGKPHCPAGRRSGRFPLDENDRSEV
jgi:hypothetical protein